MESFPSLFISQEDFQKISNLLTVARPEIADLLADELNRAHVLAEDQLPANTVTMNSIVTYVDLDTKQEQTVCLVYPHEANIQQGKVSILAPVGAALIGMQAGCVIDWPISETKIKRIQVTAVRKSDEVREWR